MKTKLLISVMTLGIIAILVVVGWRALPNSQSSTVNEQSSSIANAGASPLLSDIPTSPAIDLSLKAVNNGLTAEIREYDLNPDNPTVTICTDLPSIADWLPIFSAKYNGKTVDVGPVMVIDPQNTAYLEGNRCYLAMLKEGIFGPNQSGKLVFSMEYFQMSIPERLPDEIILKAKKNLNDKGLSIDFEIEDVDHGQIIVITKKPSGYTDEQTYQVIQDAIAQSPERVRGPWIFVIDVK